MRTYVREATRDPSRGAPAGRRRRQRLRDRPPPRRPAHDRPRLAQAPLRPEAPGAVELPAMRRARRGRSCTRRRDYAELLGLYLGDGHITDLARSQRLRLFLDAQVPDDRATTPSELLRRCFRSNRRRTRGLPTTARMAVLWRLLIHLTLPVPAARRRQEARAADRAGALAAGARRRSAVGVPPRAASDPTAASSSTGPGRYEYLSYDFAN